MVFTIKVNIVGEHFKQILLYLAHLADPSFLEESLDFLIEYVGGFSGISGSNALPRGFTMLGRIIASPE